MRHPILVWIALAAGYVCVTVAATWPLAAHLASHLPKDLGDPLLSAWLLAWHAQVPPFTDTWWNGIGFHPAPDTLALSDHRLGLALFSTPVLWLGGTPASAYNVTLILGFASSGLAMHALVHRLTGRHDAGAIAGVVFAFPAYRFGHVEHLELIVTPWLPLSFLALHAWLDGRRTRALVLFALCWTLQGVTAGYYFFYGLVLLVLWALWFLRLRRWREDLLPFGGALAACGAALAPILLRYHQVHERLRLRREIDEIERYGADVTALLSGSPLLDLLPALEGMHQPEGRLFPGFVPMALVAVAVWRSRRRPHVTSGPARVRAALVAIAAVGMAAAAGVILLGPWEHRLGPLRLSASGVHKPLGIALLASIGLALTAGPVIDAWRRRSPLPFYAMATVAMWLLALGPTGRVLGQRFWYKAPYAWLMQLPGFDEGFRVPARFGMLASLTLAVCAGLALARLRDTRRASLHAGTVAIASIALLEVWPGWMPLARVPPIGAIPESRTATGAVLELPLGRTEDDTLAQYRSVAHGMRVLNGYSGYQPPHYGVLRLALAAKDPRALVGWESERLFIGIPDAHDPDGEWARYAAETLHARQLAAADGMRWFLRAPTLDSTPRCGRPIPARAIHTDPGQRDPHPLLDGRLSTFWVSAGRQTGLEWLAVDLGERQRLCGVRLMQGPLSEDFPRHLIVETSHDAATWRVAWAGQTAGLATAGAVRDPSRVEILIPVAGDAARHVRLRQIGRSDEHPWAAAELEILAPRQ